MSIKKLYVFTASCFILAINSNAQENTTINSTPPCGSCETIPGKLPTFKNALTDSKVHYYTNKGTVKLDLKKAEEVCNENYFSICNNLLVLTSPGQKKDRIEIRQDKNLSLNDYSAMEFSGVYENVPASNYKKGVTIGQIHNDTKGVKRPLLRVEIAGGKAIRVIVTDTYLKGEGKVTNNFLTSFNEKDHINCKISINKASNRVTVFVKNNSTGEEKQLSYKVSKTWREKDGQFYFKAGAYTQVSGPQTKVSYDSFKFIY